MITFSPTASRLRAPKKIINTHLPEEYKLSELHPVPVKELPDELKHIPSRMEAALARAKTQYWSLLPALQLLKPTPVAEPIKHLSTDGEHLFYNPEKVEKRFDRLGETSANARLSAELLHIVIHGILGHFEKEYKDEKLSWAIMDLLVDRFIRECFPAEIRGNRETKSEDENKPQEEPDTDFEGPDLSQNPFFPPNGGFTDISNGADNNLRLQKLLEKGLGAYYVIQPQKKSRAFLLMKAHRRCLDNHRIWHQSVTQNGEKDNRNEGKNGNSEGKKTEKSTAEKWREVSCELLGIQKPEAADTNQLQQAIAKLTGYGGIQQGSGAGGEVQKVQAVRKSRSDYTSTLRKLCREREATHEDPDTIDYMLYQYGFDMYGDVPLVEPLEENPQLQLDHIALAIDTSGSCSGPVAQLFLEETVRIFQNVGSLAKPKRIHLIECDDDIQNITGFKSIKEMRDYVSGGVSFHGFGGTSFVPVYDWIEKYNNNHSTDKIRALFYLTDGYGDFPDDNKEIQSAIRSFFILPESSYESLEVMFEEREWITPLEIKEPENLEGVLL